MYVGPPYTCLWPPICQVYLFVATTFLYRTGWRFYQDERRNKRNTGILASSQPAVTRVTMNDTKSVCECQNLTHSLGVR